MQITLHSLAIEPTPFSVAINDGVCDHLLLQLGTTAIGVRSKDGVVLVVEKRVTSPLLVCGHPYGRPCSPEALLRLIQGATVCQFLPLM